MYPWSRNKTNIWGWWSIDKMRRWKWVFVKGQLYLMTAGASKCGWIRYSSWILHPWSIAQLSHHSGRGDLTSPWFRYVALTPLVQWFSRGRKFSMKHRQMPANRPRSGEILIRRGNTTPGAILRSLWCRKVEKITLGTFQFSLIPMVE